MSIPSSLWLLLLLACTLWVCGGQTQYLQVQVDPVAVTRANFYLNQLATQVQTFSWPFCNRPLLASTLANTLLWLRRIRAQLPCGNLIDGSGNAVTGRNNVVVGSRNRVTGANNWVFVSNYEPALGAGGFTDSVLAIGNYQINLLKAALIPTTPTAAISLIERTAYDALCSQNVATSFFFAN